MTWRHPALSAAKHQGLHLMDELESFLLVSEFEFAGISCFSSKNCYTNIRLYGKIKSRLKKTGENQKYDCIHKRYFRSSK